MHSFEETPKLVVLEGGDRPSSVARVYIELYVEVELLHANARSEI